MKLRKAAVVVALLGVFAAAGAQPSFADSQIRGDGVSASFQSWGEKFRLWDTECSDRPSNNGGIDYHVYLVYKRYNASERRIDYNSRCGTMALYDRNFYEGQKIDYKACVDFPWQELWGAGDHCSDWVRDTT
jgi:hypothetical protein